MKTRLEEAILFAIEVHSGQVDKGGHEAILHALRVMVNVVDSLKIPAVLHDVVEDGATIIFINEGGMENPYVEWRNTLFKLTDSEFKIVIALTKRESEPYHNYVVRVQQDVSATMIKIADIEDHLHLDRLKDIPTSLIKRYTSALETLTL